MNAQAEQMKSISFALVNIIGGSANGVGHGIRSDVQTKKGISGILSTVTGKRATGKGAAPHKKGREVHPNQVIPMEEGQFKDF
jgi:hypothetical protein